MIRRKGSLLIAVYCVAFLGGLAWLLTAWKGH
jgi:hypothetical protein